MSVKIRRDGSVGLAVLDNPPVNAIGKSERADLLAAVRWAESEGLERVVLTGAGSVFAAGADAREFDLPPEEPHLPDVLNALESSPVPWIAAINGVALGGGAEIAMACRMRIMSPNARIGLPEVTLGVIPGAGGTQRLPRLVGVAMALDMICGGKPVPAADALKAGLADAVDADPVKAALNLSAVVLADRPRTSSLAFPEAPPEAFRAARDTAARKQAGQIAPGRAIDAIEAGRYHPFPDALAIERAAFLELRAGSQARALRHVFFAERAAKAPGWLRAEPRPTDRVAVVGGGTMGAGIAYALLNAGCRVTLLETDEQGVARAVSNVEAIVQAGLKRGLIDAARADRLRAGLDVSQNYADASDATLAIEAAFESIEVKRAVFGQLDAALPPRAILATNTSYLDINRIAASVRDPSRVLGLHFFAPAHIMKLLEVVRADATSDEALATGFALAGRLRKIPVLAGVCDGFIGNRILARYREAADTVLMDGSSPAEVDAAMVGFGYAMGPYEAQDLSGLDIAFANRRRQDATRDPKRLYAPMGDRLVELGRLGRKTGAGWYLYPEGGGKIADSLALDLAIEAARDAGRKRRAFTPEDIRHRLVLAMINEAADILHEGIALSARDIDLVTVFGYGFPRWRGGLMHHADQIGCRRIVADLADLAGEDPIAWRISPLLLECAERGTTLAEARPPL